MYKEVHQTGLYNYCTEYEVVRSELALEILCRHEVVKRQLALCRRVKGGAVQCGCRALLFGWFITRPGSHEEEGPHTSPVQSLEMLHRWCGLCLEAAASCGPRPTALASASETTHHQLSAARTQQSPRHCRLGLYCAYTIQYARTKRFPVHPLSLGDATRAPRRLLNQRPSPPCDSPACCRKAAPVTGPQDVESLELCAKGATAA